MEHKFRPYLFTRVRAKGESGRTKLKVRVVAKGREITATLPLLVTANFSKYYHSNGKLKDGYNATSIQERHDDECIKAAYESVCIVADFMLSQGDEYWQHAPATYFRELLTSTFEDACNGIAPGTNLRLHMECQEQRKAQGLPTDEEENLAEWKEAKEAHKG